MSRLADVIASLRAGASPVCETLAPGPEDYGILALSAITSGDLSRRNAKKLAATRVKADWPSLRRGTVLVSRASGSRDLVGACVLVETDEPKLIPPDTAWVLEVSERHSARALVEYLRSPKGRKAIHEIARGSNGTWKISQESFLSLRMPVLNPEAEQQVDLLSRTFDTNLSNLDALIQEKRKFKQGLAQQLLTGRRRLPKFHSSEWVETSLGDLFEEIERPVAWSDETHYRLVSIRRRSGGMFLREVKRGTEIKTKQMFTVRTGDIVISRMQVVHGALAIVPPELDGCHVSGTYYVLVPRKGARVKSEFFNYLSQHPRMYHAALVSSYGVHIEKMTFNPEWYLQTKVRIPSSMEEQKQIVETLELLDAEIDLLFAQRENISLYKRGLLTRLLSGEDAVMR